MRLTSALSAPSATVDLFHQAPWRAVFAVAGILFASTALAQPPVLLPVPEGPGSPGPCCPAPLDERGQPLAYDRSLLYLPDQHPNTGRDFEARPRDERAFWGRAAWLYGQTQGLAGRTPDWRSGVDAAVGVWWDDARSRGAEAGALFLGDGRTDRPGGTFESRFVTAHADYRANVGKVGHVKLDVLTGYRFASVNEGRDRLSASNHYHGGTLGLAGELRSGPWSIECRASVALGATFFDRNGRGDRTFATAPETAVTLGRELLDGSRLFVGYRLAAIDRIARPDGAADARSRFRSQGVMLGLDWWF
jgi:hypothetical protein